VAKPVTLGEHHERFLVRQRKETTAMTITSHDFASFGTLLQAMRRRQHLTQQQLAQAIGVHRRTVIRWEQGDVLPESKALVLELARHLKLDEQETRHLLEASLTALAPHWAVPFPRNPYFTGREEVLEALHHYLGTEQTVALTQSAALHGLGGVGKTQVALEYAYRYALAYRAVFWLAAESVISSFLAIAEVLQLPGRDDMDQQRVVASVQRWLATHPQWLLIWDNVEDLELLQHFLPWARHGALLLTTRAQAVGTLAVGLELEPLLPEESLLLLLRRAKLLPPQASSQQVHKLAARLPAESAAAEELVKTLGGLPLALDQAGAYLEETGCGLVGYVERYQQQSHELLARRGAFGADHPHSVMTTFRLSYERVQQTDPVAEDLLTEGALHLGPLRSPLATNLIQLDQALSVLRNLSLVKRYPETQTLSLHRLVQAVLQETMTRAEREQWSRSILEALEASFPEVEILIVEPTFWKKCERLLPHALHWLHPSWGSGEPSALASLANKTAQYLYQRGFYEQAEQLYQRALGIWEQTSGPDHPQWTYPLLGLAVLYSVQGKSERAEPLFQRALSIREQTLGSDHPQVAQALYGLAVFSMRHGKSERAEPLLQRACSIWEHTLRPDHPLRAQTLLVLAELYQLQGKFDQAERLSWRALGLWEQALGPGHPLVARALQQLGILYTQQGKFDQAEPLLQRALHIREQTLGSDHDLVAHPLYNLAELYQLQGKFDQAEPLLQRALHIWEQALGLDHSLVSASLRSLAALYQEQGKDAQAESHYQRALFAQEQQPGPYIAGDGQTLYDLALLRQKQGKLSEAIVLCRRALKLRSQFLGETHPQTVITRTLYLQLLEQREAPEGEISDQPPPAYKSRN
jgi:tetratricopeptide (TPR) repeat protein